MYAKHMELYHLINRGVDKRTIFQEDGDRIRFVHDLYVFNDSKPANNTTRNMNDLRSRSLESKRDMLVTLHAWCLMDNHFHLLVSENVEGGLTAFIRRLNIGYAKYFNDKYQRSGALFQGRTKKVLIERNAHYLHILNYIHLNPLDYMKGSEEWRSRALRNSAKALTYLESYRWSSYLDYCGIKNFPSLISKDLFADVFQDYRRELGSYMRDIQLADNDDRNLE